MTDTINHEVALYKITHVLKDIKNMSTSILAEITDTQLEEYRTEHEIMRGHYRSDAEIVSGAKERVRRDISFLWGNYGKQAKYLERSMRNEQTHVDVHYSNYTEPRMIERMVGTAKEESEANKNNTVATGLGKQSMDEIDSAIKFLISKGYSYGADFSSHNAVDIKESMAPEAFHNEVMSSWESVNKEFFGELKCCDSWDKDSFRSHPDREKWRANRIWCSCGDTKKDFSFGVVDGVLKVDMEYYDE